ncbi:unnamed protein product [Chironomus riparius]|uniref:UDP-glucuronosyltransferase n=1 Tax=Chironomus riparius TaxID=315576 RepID=A0A9N9RUH8_9DIPT|nr:unnamed protein product [Chironomus riparius]
MKLKVLYFVTLLASVRAANILYISTAPSPSHYLWCKPLLDALHDRGHNLTILSPDIESSKVNLTFLHLDQIYPMVLKEAREMQYLEVSNSNPIEMFMLYVETSEIACRASLVSKGYKQLLEYPDDFKFDLVLHDFLADPCLLFFVSKFGNPNIIGFSAYNMPTLFGANLLYPSFVPGYSLLYPTKMNFKQRLVSAFVHTAEYYVKIFYTEPNVDKIVREKHPNVPYLGDYKKNYKLFLINHNPIIDCKHPIFPNQKNVGGLQVKKPKELPDNLKAFADSATNGLVLFSLGTNVRSDSLGEERLLKILKALGRLNKYKFLWKFETSEKLPIDLPKNVKIQAWMPQNDVLAHKNTKLFISHCGLLSTQESLWYGVPVLGFPVFADQHQNAFKLNELGTSETLDVLGFTEDELYETVVKLLEDLKYIKNAKKISKALHDRPMSALEEATYWTEWLLRNPDIDLEGPAADMNLFQRHSLDLYTFALFVLFIIIYVLFKIAMMLLKLFFGINRKSEMRTKKTN